MVVYGRCNVKLIVHGREMVIAWYFIGERIITPITFKQKKKKKKKKKKKNL
jgi:hypothetical protein